MAAKSGGTIPPPTTILDANQAMALLDAVHFFAIKRVTKDDCPGVEVQITHAGRRVSAQRRTFVEATLAAFARLRGENKPTRTKREASPKLRLVK